MRQENQKGPSHHNECAEHCAKGKQGMQHTQGPGAAESGVQT